MVWHKNTDLPDGLDFVAIPGGFSFGDYLRVGAIAARSPICHRSWPSQIAVDMCSASATDFRY